MEESVKIFVSFVIFLPTFIGILFTIIFGLLDNLSDGSPIKNSPYCPDNCIEMKCYIKQFGTGLLSQGPCQCTFTNSDLSVTTYCEDYKYLPENATYFDGHQDTLLIVKLWVAYICFVAILWSFCCCKIKTRNVNNNPNVTVTVG